ncbi:MAG: dihydrofolate reductase [Bacilli bacterium]
MISLIVAYERSRGMGRDGDMPWRLGSDLKYFREKTTGHTVLMGRQTYESIGRPLPNRTNVVASRHLFEVEGVQHTFDAVEFVRTWSDGELFVVGGAQIYAAALPYADRLLITEIDADISCDTFFPEWDRDAWTCVATSEWQQTERDDWPIRFTVYERK